MASDHAPWDLADKSHPAIFDNHSGAPGVETLVPVVLSEGLARGIPIDDPVQGPVRGAGAALPAPEQGCPRCPASTPISWSSTRPPRAWSTSRRLHSNAGWSPYHGRRLDGQVTAVISRGEVVWDGELDARPGRGRFVVPDPSR